MKSIIPFPPPHQASEPAARSHRLPAIAVTTLALLAPGLGGSTQLWAQALLVLALATLLLLCPPRRLPSPIWTTLLLAIGLLSLPSFLPAKWFGLAPWRQTLLSQYEVALPSTLSPQPWLSAQATCLLFAGLVFAAYLLTQSWDERARRQVLQYYAIGIIVLATAALISHFSGHKIPFWPSTLNSPINFGFFPNRNQTANVLALAGIVATALAFDAFERQKPIGWAWLAAVLLLGVALVINFSRAGIALFLGGTICWIIAAFAFSASKKVAALGVVGISLLLTLFLLFGGETLGRFQARGVRPATDFRVAIQSDAWKLAANAPWSGQGLGNFEPVFATARDQSAGQNRAIHPESDWLWIAVEMGWPAAALLLAAFLFWIRQCLPFAPGSGRFLRSAALVCGIAFALHGLVDVSGHRPGALWPALFLSSLALLAHRPRPAWKWSPPLFRVLGILLGGVGLWWMASYSSTFQSRVKPTTRTLASLTTRLDAEISRGEYSRALATAEEALSIAPLDWNLYYQKGVAQAALSPFPWVASRSFKISRFLERHWVDSCFQEGKLWLSIDQFEYAIDAWTEALRRAGPDSPALFSQMLAGAGPRFTMHDALHELARTDRDYLLRFIQYADRLECDLEIGRLLDEDPTLHEFTTDQRKLLFRAWFTHGDRSLLAAQLAVHPEWLSDGWPWLALTYAEDQEFERAYRVAKQFAAPPILPSLTITKSLAALEQQYRFHPNNFQEGLELYSAQRGAGLAEAAATTLATLQTLPDRPSYVVFLESEVRAELGQWPEAWEAWRRYSGDNFP